MFLIYIIRFNICNVYLKRFNFNKRQDANHFPFAVCDLNTDPLYDNKKLYQLNQLKTYKNTINII